MTPTNEQAPAPGPVPAEAGTARLHDKVALVTGASSGIGEAAARALAAQGASVVLAARRREQLDRVADDIAGAGGVAITVRVDVTVDDDVEAAVRAAEDEFGGLDIAFNSAGGLTTHGLVGEQKPEVWVDDVYKHLGSVFLSMRHEIPAMLRRGGGSIVNNASVYGLVGLGVGISSYVAAKHGIIGLTKAAALEYARENVRINALALATVDTAMTRTLSDGVPGMQETFVSQHPVGRIGTPAEAASAVAYLAGDDASFFTGSVLLMDGGYTAG